MASIQKKTWKKKGKTIRRYYTVVSEYDSSGKRKLRWLGGHSTKREAERAMPDLIKAFHDGDSLQESKKTVSEYLYEWLELRNPKVKNKGSGVKVKAQTWHNDKSRLERYVIPEIGDLLLSRVTYRDVDGIYSRMLSGALSAKNRGLSPNTIRRVHIVLRKAFGDAMKHEGLKSNPCLNCENVPTSEDAKKHIDEWRESNRVWTVIELQKFLKFCVSCGFDDGEHRLRVAFCLAATTALRAGEICGLRWSSIDFDNKSMRVRETIAYVVKDNTADKAESSKQFDTPKSRSSNRTITLSDDTVKLLWNHKLKQQNDLEALGHINQENLVFLNDDGVMLDPKLLGKIFRKAVKQAKKECVLVEDCSTRIHDLRHLSATIMVASGTDIRTVSSRLGHASVGTTLNLYVAPVAENEREAAEVLSSKIFGD